MAERVTFTIDLKGDLTQGLAGAQVEASGLDRKIRGLSDRVEELGRKAFLINELREGFGAFNDVVGESSMQIAGLQQDLKLLTDVSEENQDIITRGIVKIGDRYDKDYREVILSANSLTKQLGGTFEENIKRINQGFESGADLNGDFLDQLREYSPQFKAIGLSADQAINLMSQSAKQGVFSDKGADTVKEAGLRLREMPKATLDALAGIGLSGDLIQKQLTDGSLTTFQAIQLVSSKLGELPPQSKEVGTAIADIYGGPGEDAGLDFIVSLQNVQSTLGDTEQQLTGFQKTTNMIKGWFSDVKVSVFNATGEFMPFISGGLGALETVLALAPGLQVVAGMMNFTAIKQKLLTAQQWLYNAALNANPIGLVVAGLAALTAGVVYAWNTFEGFRGVIYGLWDSMKIVGVGIKDTFIAYFGGIAQILASLATGDYEGVLAGFKRMGGNIASTVTGTATAARGAYHSGFDRGVADFRADHAEGKAGSTTPTAAKPLDAGGPSVRGRPLKSLAAQMAANKDIAAKLTDKKTGGKATATTSTTISGRTGGKTKAINVSINKLVESLNISLASPGELSNGQLRDAVNEALTSAIRDFEISYS